MGKGPEWGDDDTIQLCKAWIYTFQDPIRGAGQKKATFYMRMYQLWLQIKSKESDDRSELAVAGRLKKLQPAVTKFEGIYSKLKSRERSGWNEEKYITSAVGIYAERHKQQFEILAAWKELRDKPKWTAQLTTTAGSKRRGTDASVVCRPQGQKAAKRSKGVLADDIQQRFVAASEKKELLMEQQLPTSSILV
ncbi:uncharacterized protein PITG_15587 [Phytophthora infestans T30-4]|uniref:No apical meristem-associated C-terminal domain-containing protein n=1 Tax=Phytophthora infestans (strain T30-4) TaxID=403677 RepID=D0NT45_PHYIT|nr:uncharacterized protein PITG_15587 [Phytophthora infestans T30-4]EEY64801.1 conserved hypothetical protein [Phytophthora infestans T30-4]|eukprot:XP_002897728.1 conserved hypothetical protein [Phytophthora infestans T30-4]